MVAQMFSSSDEVSILTETMIVIMKMHKHKQHAHLNGQ